MMMTKRKMHSTSKELQVWLLIWVQILMTWAVQVDAKARTPLLVVFGDSSVDSGNNNHVGTVLKSDFEPYGRDFAGGRATGRFSNGRIATDYVAEALGMKPAVPAYLDPSHGIADFTSAVCFASAGTGYDNVTAKVLNVVPLWKELEYFKEYQRKLRGYLGVRRANRRLREALYLINIGTNDFLENYYLLPLRKAQFSVGEFEDFLVGIAERFLTSVYELGARKISIGGLPPMGCLPLERTANLLSDCECNEEYNRVAMDFNRKLQAMVGRLQFQLKGIQLVFSSVYEGFMDLIQNPSLYESGYVGRCQIK